MVEFVIWPARQVRPLCAHRACGCHSDPLHIFVIGARRGTPCATTCCCPHARTHARARARHGVHPRHRHLLATSTSPGHVHMHTMPRGTIIRLLGADADAVGARATYAACPSPLWHYVRAAQNNAGTMGKKTAAVRSAPARPLPACCWGVASATPPPRASGLVPLLGVCTGAALFRRRLWRTAAASRCRATA